MKSRYLITGALTLVLTGCAEFAPPPDRNAQAVLQPPAQFAAGQSGPTALIKGMNDLFDDAQLTGIVNRALKNNPDVQLAARQMELAGFNARIVGASLSPSVSGSFNTTRTGGSGPTGGTSRPSLDVSWEADVWGRLRDSRSAARLDASAEADQLQAVRASIAAQVMQSWFEYARASQAVSLESSRLAALKQREEFVRRDYRAGVGSLDDLSAIRRDVALSQEVLLANQGTRNEAARVLELLLGEYPDAMIKGAPRLPRIGAAPRAGVPASVLTNRPDLRAAWSRVEAADKRISVAQKDLLPQISLTGSLGSTTSDFSDLLSGATIWTLAGQLTAPVFDGSRRKTEILASRNRADQAWITYLQTALRAFSEVEQALDQERLLRGREAELRKAVEHARTTADLFETRYQAGLTSILELLNAQNAVFDIRGQLLAVRSARLSNRVTLALALGKEV
ncbi:efflux transporter outer membrane subunit [Roseibium sp. RKSG952]|uniref:efflux transporter outer membrane subunit n=1 Tax=Roseibium sp. RKSG952 TaxID=2529384 RepID=UPI0012BBFCE0|nr:TolC family protein [Roseibium sp. RKSG952]MTH97190.1 TolC family protein [Roseibium sp. RKSG952]